MPSGQPGGKPHTLGLCALLVALGLAHPGSAALWEDELWEVAGQAAVTAGYDSDIFGVNGGPSDEFATFRPSLDLIRKNTELNFDADIWYEYTAFLKNSGSDSSDDGVRVTVLYPNEQSLTAQSAEVHWIRETAVDVDVGARLTQDDALAKYQGTLLDSGKTSLDGSASFERDDYLGSGYQTIESGTAGAGVGYSPNGLFKAGLGYVLTLANSSPNTPGQRSIDLTEQAVQAQASGEFAPTLTGKVSVGAASTRYTGGFTNSQWEAVAAADLTWKPRERLAIDLTASRNPSFSANGYVDVTSDFEAVVTQDMKGGFSLRAGGLVGRTDQEQAVVFRTDNFEGAQAGLGYSLTGKLTASLGYNWTRQDSDVARFTYQRHIVTGQLLYKF